MRVAIASQSSPPPPPPYHACLFAQQLARIFCVFVFVYLCAIIILDRAKVIEIAIA